MEGREQRVGVFGWGVVAPRSPNIAAFARNLESAEHWLSPFDGFGPDSFLVGRPDFSFEDYRGWIEARFAPARFQQLERKMGRPVKYAIGSFIQALEQNPGIEDELRRLGTRTHVYVGTGLGDLDTIHRETLALHRAQRRWNRFWAAPERNRSLRDHLAGRDTARDSPAIPSSVPAEERDLAEDDWFGYWAARSDGLQEFLTELREIERAPVGAAVETAKLSTIKAKRRRVQALVARWNAPEPPWEAVSPSLLWNIPNMPASQISILGRLTGLAFCPAAACSSFGVTLKLAMDAIRSGDAVAVVIGATDPPPHPLSVGAFYEARVLSADAEPSKPLTELRGTHVAGGAVVWIVADLEHMEGRGFTPLGMEPVSAGATSDADHIITPSKEGPSEAVRIALRGAGIDADALGSFDLHATATPGDVNEVELVRALVPRDVLITARKGTFGHGMSVAGGWELTAQYLGYERGRLFPTTIQRDELAQRIAACHGRFVFDASAEVPEGLAGKLSMGIGGINACVLSRPLARRS